MTQILQLVYQAAHSCLQPCLLSLASLLLSEAQQATLGCWLNAFNSSTIMLLSLGCISRPTACLSVTSKLLFVYVQHDTQQDRADYLTDT